MCNYNTTGMITTNNGSSETTSHIAHVQDYIGLTVAISQGVQWWQAHPIGREIKNFQA